MASGEAGPRGARRTPWYLRALTLRIAGLLISAAAIVVVVGSVDISASVDQLRTARPLPLLAASLLVFVQLTLVTLRWSLLLPAPADGTAPPWFALTRAVAIGYLGNFVLPARLGELVRSAYASRRWRIGLAQTIGSVALERVIDTAVLAMIALALAMFLGAPGWVVQISALAALTGVAVLVILASGVGPRLAGWMARAGGPSIVRAIAAALREFLVGASGQQRSLRIVAATILSIGSWTVEGIVYWLVAASLGVEVSLATALLVAAVTVLATAIPAAPAYVGTFELAVTSVAGAMGVSPAAALAWGLVAHVVTVVPLMLSGLFALLTAERGFREMLDDVRRTEPDVPALG
jgi:uncharacterized protein (TIRG00374 family)